MTAEHTSTDEADRRDGSALSEGLGLVERLPQRTLPEHGGKADSWAHHWNLTHGDSALHAEARAEIERLRAALRLAREGYASEAITGLPVQPVWRERTMARIDEALGA